MIEEFKAFFTLFQQGKAVANPQTWRDNKAIGNAILGLLSAALIVAQGFGYTINVSPDVLQAAAAGVVAIVGVVNAVIHVITSTHLGVKAD